MRLCGSLYQSSYGFPEPEGRAADIMSDVECRTMFAKPHAFSEAEFVDLYGIGHCYRCELNFTVFTVVVHGDGRYTFGKSSDAHSNFTKTTSTCEPTHKAIMAHFNL